MEDKKLVGGMENFWFSLLLVLVFIFFLMELLLEEELELLLVFFVLVVGIEFFLVIMGILFLVGIFWEKNCNMNNYMKNMCNYVIFMSMSVMFILFEDEFFLLLDLEEIELFVCFFFFVGKDLFLVMVGCFFSGMGFWIMKK